MPSPSGRGSVVSARWPLEELDPHEGGGRVSAHVIHVTGTLINAGTVLLGSVAGTLLGERLSERIRETVMSALGLVTILLGVDQGLLAFRGPLADLTPPASWSSWEAFWLEASSGRSSASKPG